MAPPVYIQLPLFILDKRCTKCGQYKPLGEFRRGRARCKICLRQESRAHYRAHIEHHRATALAYYYAHLQQQQANAHAWKRKNHAKVRAYKRGRLAVAAAYSRKYYAAHAAERIAYAGRYWREHRDEENRKRRERYRLDPHPARMYVRRREARKRDCEGTHTLAEWEALKALYGHRCLRCGTTERQLTADHIVPLTKGGTDYIDNIQPLCRPCNSTKHDKIIDYRPANRRLDRDEIT